MDVNDKKILKAIEQLKEGGYSLLTPFLSECAFDLIAYKDEKYLRIVLDTKKIVSENAEYDFIALYLEQVSMVIFLKSTDLHIKVRYQVDFTNFENCYWFNDFILPYEKLPEKIDILSKVMEKNISSNSIECKKQNYTSVYHSRSEVLPLIGNISDNVNFNIGMNTQNFNPIDVMSVSYLPLKSNYKINWPTKEQLSDLIFEKSFTDIALIYGVTDRTVSNWVKDFGLESPPKGYWISKTKQAKNIKEKSNE